jgi:hypothetical protein
MLVTKGDEMGEYEDVSIKLGEVSRKLSDREKEIVYLLELLRRCVVALDTVSRVSDHCGLSDFDMLRDAEDELSLWKTERVKE